MTTAQSIELSIRAAAVVRHATRLIGVRDAVLASAIVNECASELKRLADFVAKLKP